MLKISENLLKQTLILVYLSLWWFTTTAMAQSTNNSCPRSDEFNDHLRPAPLFIDEEVNMDISAEKMEFLENGNAMFKGDVELFQKERQLRAEQVNFYSHEATGAAHDTADIQGNVHFWDSTQYIQSEEAYIEFTDTTEEVGTIDNVTFSEAEYIVKGQYYTIAVGATGKFKLPSLPSSALQEGFYQGQAESLYVIANERIELTNGDYSTCSRSDNLWRISAHRITLDQVNQVGSASHMIFKIKDIPVFYFPYLTFSLNKKRKTGFLTPTYGASSRGGVLLTLPFYWNIKPNMDATLTARHLDKDGSMLISDYRYLFKKSSGSVHAEYLSGSKKTAAQNEYLLGFTHNQSFLGSGRVSINYNYTSYERYLEDLGPRIGFTSRQFLDRQLKMNYSGSGWSIEGMVKSYQTLDPSIAVRSRPYKRLPQIRFNAKSPARNNALNYQLKSELIYFHRSANVSDAMNVNGLRVDLFPSFSLPLKNSAAYFTPTIGARYTQYYLDETGPFEESPYRLLPSLNIDAGIFLERDFSLFGHGLKQTLDPRVFYVYVPEEDQSDLPIFDTSVSGFSQSAFFRTERFNGPDRMGDANQITLGLSSRILHEDSGKTLLEANATQIYYFKDRTVTLPNGQGSDDDTSSLLIGGLKGTLGHWSLRNSLQWDPKQGFVTLFSSRLQYNNTEGQALNLDYRLHRYTNTVVRQVSTSFSLPIGDRWNAVGKLRYEVREKRTPDAFFGIEYEGCCWAGRFVVKRFLTNSRGLYDFGFFYQIQLKGLVDFGVETLSYFRQIPGYKREF